MVLSRNRQALTGDVSIRVEDGEIIAGKLTALHHFQCTVRCQTQEVAERRIFAMKVVPSIPPFASLLSSETTDILNWHPAILFCYSQYPRPTRTLCHILLEIYRRYGSEPFTRWKMEP
jgi:hypothetical protein